MIHVPLFSPEGHSPALELADVGGKEVAAKIEEGRRILSAYDMPAFRADLAVAPLNSRPEALQRHDRIGHGRIKRLLAQGALNDAMPSYTVWAHQYLTDIDSPVSPLSAHPALQRHHQEGERWHHHTGLLVARLLKGYYVAGERRRIGSYQPTTLTQDDFERWEDFAASLRPQKVAYSDDNTAEQPSIMSIDLDEIHRLQKIGANTISVIIKFPIRNYSLLFNEHDNPRKPLTVFKALPSGILTPKAVPADERQIPNLTLL